MCTNRAGLQEDRQWIFIPVVLVAFMMKKTYTSKKIHQTCGAEEVIQENNSEMVALQIEIKLCKLMKIGGGAMFATSIDAYGDRTCVTTNIGTIWCWGDGDDPKVTDSAINGFVAKTVTIGDTYWLRNLN